MQRETVEKGLKKLVENAKKEIPLLSEIRIFGSYNNGDWNPKYSDLDIFVEIDNETFSFIDENHLDKIQNLRKMLKERLNRFLLED
jgi:predicted nucleotidyltransferase